MNLPELFKGLKLDTWYKTLVYLGGFLLVMAFFFEVKGITNGTLQLLSGGACLFGLGVWTNIKIEHMTKPPNAYTGPAMLITITKRQPNLFGVVLEISGIVLIAIGVVKIVVSLL